MKKLQQDVGKPNSAIHEKDHIHDQMGFISGILNWFNIYKPIKIHHIKKSERWKSYQ